MRSYAFRRERLNYCVRCKYAKPKAGGALQYPEPGKAGTERSYFSSRIGVNPNEFPQ